ncbi:hypothetical protein BC792_12211 [Sphingobacterium allocomposti]|uniref:Uncharacterized protein n=1 Tax=Sphingobacterium allocomposti TaxID=415956 RepID=A0A5S5D6I0_9SPHI|nr:hypothetical protein [Sphingobacterium composti Yoo et al. 2007 non Ten et al. 2007]TYP91044.1 hypothetical protein BC792_12211 [Sphingobacterium composti Yoo et al. 2007 non Ten et al. 2007]
MLTEFFTGYGFWIVLVASGLLIVYRFIDHFLNRYLEVKREQNSILRDIARLLDERGGF